MNVYACMPSFFSFAIISFNFFFACVFLSVILYFSHFVLEKLNVGWSGTATWIYSFCSVCLNSVIRRSSNTYAIAHEISHFLLPSLPISWFLALICFILLGRTSRILFFPLVLFLHIFVLPLCPAIFNFSHKLQNSHNFFSLHIFTRLWHSLHGSKNEGNDSVYCWLFLGSLNDLMLTAGCCCCCYCFSYYSHFEIHLKFISTKENVCIQH